MAERWPIAVGDLVCELGDSRRMLVTDVFRGGTHFLCEWRTQPSNPASPIQGLILPRAALTLRRPAAQ